MYANAPINCLGHRPVSVSIQISAIMNYVVAYNSVRILKWTKWFEDDKFNLYTKPLTERLTKVQKYSEECDASVPGIEEAFNMVEVGKGIPTSKCKAHLNQPGMINFRSLNVTRL